MSRNKFYKQKKKELLNNALILSISKIVDDFNSDIPKRQENSRLFWDLIERKLSLLIRKAADLALQKNLIEKVSRDKYFVSSKPLLFIFFNQTIYIYNEKIMNFSNRNGNLWGHLDRKRSKQERTLL